VDDVALLVKGDNAKENCEQLTDIHESVCKKWARSHGAKFSTSKYQLCHITRKRQDTTDTITINRDTTVVPKEAVKYLGVMLDSKLNWKAQINGNKTKALKTIGALSSLAGSTWGARLVRMRQMMHAVFMPQLTHGCSVWYTPHEEKGHSKGVVNSLASVQYRAQRAITGAYRATSRSALQIETYSLPMHIYLDRMACLTALRIANSPAYDAIVGVRSRKKSRIVSSLEKLTNRLERKTNTSIDNLEIITPFAAPPWWIPPTTSIKSSKEIAEKAHKKLLEETNALVIYTGGSGINKKIGAAPVSPHRTIRSYLGPNTAFTVYSAELYGIVLASILALIPGHDKTHVIICIDDQAAIRAIENPGNSSGQHLVKNIVKFINLLRKKGIEIELHWVPAHIGIKGSEMADIAAKQATGWRQKKNRRGKLVEYDTDRTAKPATLAHHLRSARKMVLAKEAQQQDYLMEQGPGGQRAIRIAINSQKGSIETSQWINQRPQRTRGANEDRKDRSSRVSISTQSAGYGNRTLSMQTSATNDRAYLVHMQKVRQPST
jgi:ribonuclease HI